LVTLSTAPGYDACYRELATAAFAEHPTSRITLQYEKNLTDLIADSKIGSACLTWMVPLNQWFVFIVVHGLPLGVGTLWVESHANLPLNRVTCPKPNALPRCSGLIGWANHDMQSVYKFMKKSGYNPT